MSYIPSYIYFSQKEQPREENMEVRETAEKDTVSIRTSTPVEKLSEVMGQAYGEIMQHLGPKGIQPTGPPFAIYYNMDMTNLDVEMGFPVASSVEGAGRVKSSKLPGGRAAVTIHVGPYEKIDEAYNGLMAFVKEKGLETDVFSYEFYLNDPREEKPEDLQTEIYFPIKS
jgi:effector-binding domain-containing protein